MKIVIQIVEEKDSFIVKLEKKQEEVEDKFEKRYNELGNVLKWEHEQI